MANRSGTLWPSEHDMDSEIRVMLDNDSVWQEFHSIETEMLLTRKGRRMFPFCRYRLTGLAPRGLYFLVMDFQLLDEQRYRWTVEGRVPCGPSETHEARGRVYTHPSSPTTGSVWMEDPVVFRAVKLTSNLQNNDGLVVLHSNHRYIPRLHVVPFDPYGRNTVDLDSPETQTFVFPQTEFYAVSCYQNPRLIKLKIKHNPFASQFRHEEMQSDQLMQLPPGGAHESSASLSPDSKHAKGNKWAKKRSSLPSSAEYGLGASLVFKKRMHLSERSLGNDSSRLSGGLNCTEEMFCTDDESHDGDGDDESTQWPLKARLSAPSLKKQVPAKFKSRATASKVSARTFTSTPRVMKRPSLTSQKTPKMRPHRRKSTGSGKNARGSNAVTEAPSEPVEPLACELAVDDVEGMLFVSFSSKDSHDTHVPLKRQPPPLPPQPPLPPPPPSPPSKCPPVLQVQVATRATEPEEVTGEGPEVQQESIVQLQKVLLLDLGFNKHRQVIHPALQQVGLKLNLVDPEVAIDLQYLGVALPLPPFPQSCAEGTIPFVSRTGKTNDLTKIKGWRDKYSSSSDLPSGPPQERAVKVPSAFSSELLDEYLESEGQSISERAETFSSFSDPAAAAAAAGVAYSLPSRGSSYVRTLDSVLKSHVATAIATTSARPTAATRSPTWPAGTSNAKPSPKPGPNSHQVPVHSLKHSPIPGGMSPGVSQSWGSRAHPGGKAPLKRDASLGVSRYTGFTVSQRHLQALEKHAFCRGHTDTYITTERATVALSVLLTAQGSVKADRVSWTTADVLGPCQRDCCRLGCVCLSLTREPRGPTHCRRPQCMFECACFRHRVLLVRPHPDSNTKNNTKTGAQGWRKRHVEKTADEDPKLLAYPISDADKSPRPSPGQRVRVLWEGRASETDPEPLYRPERQRVDTDRTSVLSVALSKPASRSQPRGGGRRVDEVEKDSPVYMYFDSMMTCARVRPINSMPPPQMHILPFAVTDRAKEKAHPSPETSVGKLDAAPSQKSAQVAQKQVLETEAQPTKLLEIVSECNWEPHRNLVLSALNRRLKLNLLTPSFRLGFYRVRLLSTDRQKGLNHSTITYKLSISHIDNDSDDSAEKKSQKKPKLQPPQPPKPGYLKAFKLRPSGSPNRLVEVNGKHYAKARLMLGRMGALHPANRLAAFVTGRMVTLPQTEAEERLRAAVRKTSEALSSSAASSQTQETSVGERAPEPLADAPPKEPCASQLLYIPIGSPDGVTPPAQSTLDPAGLVTHAQKVMLKPVGSTQKGALYRQPNGQLVQLVPLKPLQAIRPKPTLGSAPGIQSVFLTPSGPWPENSSSSQDGSTDPDTPPVTPDASAVVAKRFSLSGKSTMCISQGSAAVRTLPGVGAFSFRICPPSEQSKPQALDSQALGEDQNPSQNTSSSLALPGGFTLIQLPKASDGEVKMSVGGAKTAAAAFPQVIDKSYGTLSRKGSKIAGMSKLDTQITGTLVKERKKIVAPVVIPPMVLGTPKPSYISPRTIKQGSGTPQASNTSIRTSRQASETPQASNTSIRTSRQASETPQASNTSIRTSRQASETPQVSNISHRTSQQESGTPQASNASFRTSRQASETPQVSYISHRTSQQDSGIPKANVAAVPPKATGTMHRGPEIQQSSERGTKVLSTPEPLNHIIKERQRRVVQENGFKRLKEVLRISNLKVTQQDILDQARLIIGALKTRERSLERRKAALRDTQSVYIKTISDLSGKSEEQIRKKLQETSKRQRLLEQYRQRQNERNKPSQTQLTAKECDWLTERFAIWKRHKRKRKRKQLLEDQEEEATGVEPAVGTLKPSWRSDVKARDSPELRAALLTPGSNAAQVSSSSQLSSPSNSGAQGQQNIPSSGLDINKVLSLLKVKSLPPQYSHLGAPVKLLLVPVLKNVGKPDEKADAEAKDPAALTDTPSTADATETFSVHAGKVTFSPFSLNPGTTEGPSVCNGRDLKGNCRAVDSSDDHSESLAEDAGNISPSGPVDASSSEHKNESRPKEVPTPGGGEVPGCNIEKPEEQPCSDVAITTETAEHQCVDESVSAAEANMANVHAKQPAPTPTPLVENGVPKRKRGRPRKHPKAERGRPRKHPMADDPTPKAQPAPPPPKTQSAAPPPKTQSAAPPPKTQSAAPPPKTQPAPPPPKTQSAAPPPKTQSAAPPPKTQSSSKHSPRLQARHLRSHLPVTTRTHTRRGKRRGRR
ncbi:MAX gene-associated protein isoform X3 [Alosa alosa]|uniref:MAX gene-associated protein isoform X3 n=1 Tax=Alosa alosa TaxID=278164 RepID=UPI0020152C6A|nr:MAX gene-associated protein isoform X3 [Alosa alosa]